MSIAEAQLAEWRRAYQILGVPFPASAPSIKRAYRGLIKRWHPDLHSGGTSAHVEATQMSELINAAYAAIRHAPLRYYAEGGPEVHGPIGNRHSADEWSETYIEAPLNTDRIEFWVRFVCGALFGLFAGLSAAFEFIDSPASLVVAGILGLIVGCGSAAAWHGDKFWRFVLGRWWIWS